MTFALSTLVDDDAKWFASPGEPLPLSPDFPEGPSSPFAFPGYLNEGKVAVEGRRRKRRFVAARDLEQIVDVILCVERKADLPGMSARMSLRKIQRLGGLSPIARICGVRDCLQRKTRRHGL